MSGETYHCPNCNEFEFKLMGMMRATKMIYEFQFNEQYKETDVKTTSTLLEPDEKAWEPDDEDNIWCTNCKRLYGLYDLVVRRGDQQLFPED